MSRGNDTDLHPKQLAKRLLLSTLVSVGPIRLLINVVLLQIVLVRFHVESH